MKCRRTCNSSRVHAGNSPMVKPQFALTMILNSNPQYAHKNDNEFIQYFKQNKFLRKLKEQFTIVQVSMPLKSWRSTSSRLRPNFINTCITIIINSSWIESTIHNYISKFLWHCNPDDRQFEPSSSFYFELLNPSSNAINYIFWKQKAY